MFSDNTSLFSRVTDPNVTANQIINDLHNINTWADQWKINFNPDTSKRVQEIIFICKIKVTAHPQLVFNNNPVHETSAQKHLEMFFNFKVNFQEYFENMFNKVNKTIRLLRKLQNVLLEHHYWQFISHSLDHTLIVAILAMIKHIIHLFNKKCTEPRQRTCFSLSLLKVVKK